MNAKSTKESTAVINQHSMVQFPHTIFTLNTFSDPTSSSGKHLFRGKKCADIYIHCNSCKNTKEIIEKDIK